MSGDENERERQDSTHSEVTKTTPDEEKQQQDTPLSFLIEWDGDNDPLDPRTFSPARKWFYVTVVAVGSLLV